MYDLDFMKLIYSYVNDEFVKLDENDEGRIKVLDMRENEVDILCESELEYIEMKFTL